MKDSYLRELIDQFLSISSRSQMETFLVGILTPAELDQLTRRLQIVKRLKRGENQREIAKELEVGISTVTRGSKEIALGRFGDLN